MGGGASLGTISAYLQLQTGNFFSGLEKAGVAVTAFGGTMNKEFAAVQGHPVSLSNAMLAAGAGIAAGLGVAVKAGSDWQKTLTATGNNTTMNAAQIRQMQSDIEALGSKSAAPLDQLANGYMHVINMGFKPGAEALAVLDAAQRSAVATGGDAGDTANILANVMHEYGMKTTEAGKAMNVLHLAAAQGNMTLEQFNEAAGPALAMAANLGVNLNDAAAAMSALTRHGFNASEAATQVRNIMAHIINPAHAVREEIEKLSKATGIDLVGDFSTAGLKAKGLSGIMADLALVHQKTGVDIMKLIPALRGGVGAMALAGTGAKDYHDILSSLGDAMSGKVDPSAEGYARTQKTLAAQTQILKNNLVVLASTVMTTLGPTLVSLTQELTKAVQWFNNLSPGTKRAVVDFAAFAAGALLLGGALGKVAGAVKGFMAFLDVMKELGTVLQVAKWLPSVVGWFTKLGGIGEWLAGAWETVAGAASGLLDVLLGVGETILTVIGEMTPIGWIITAVVAAIAGLALAWKNDWGHIREVTQGAVDWIKQAIPSGWEWVKRATADVWNWMKSEGQATWTGVKGAAGSAMDWLKTEIPAAWAAVKQAWSATWASIIRGHEDEWAQIENTARGAWTWLVNGVAGAWNAVKTGTVQAWNAIAGALGAAWSGIQAAAATAWGWFAGAWNAAWTAVKDATAVVWAGIATFLTGVWDGIKQFLTADLAEVKGIFEAGWKAAYDVSRAWWGALRGVAEATLDAIKTAIGVGLDLITGNWSRGWQTLKDGSNKVWSDLANTFAGWLNSILDLVTQFASSLFQGGVGAMHAFVNGIESMAQAPADAVHKMVAGVAAYLPHSDADMGPLSTLTASGRALPETFAEGITAGAPAAHGAMNQMLGGVAGVLGSWVKRQAGNSWLGKLLGNKGTGGTPGTDLVGVDSAQGTVWEHGKDGPVNGAAGGTGGTPEWVSLLGTFMGAGGGGSGGGAGGGLVGILSQVLGGGADPGSDGLLHGSLQKVMGGSNKDGILGGLLQGILGGSGGGKGGGGLLGGLLGGAGGGGGLLAGLGPWGSVASLGIGLLGNLFGGGGHSGPSAPVVDRPGAGDTIHVHVDAKGAFLPDQRSIESLAEMVAKKTRAQIRVRTA